MSAITFIKQHGVDRVREVVDGAPETATHLSGFTGQIYKDTGDVVYVWDGMKYHKSIYEHTRGMISLSNLKRVVESVDIITKVGGIHEAIEEHTKWMHAPELHLYRIGESVERLEQAIADYEAVYRDLGCNHDFEEVTLYGDKHKTYMCTICEFKDGGEHV